MTRTLPLYIKALGLFLAIFGLAAILFFSSCTAQRDGCRMSRGYVGYGK